MRMTLKSILKSVIQGASVLLLGAAAANAQQQINLIAGPQNAVMPDGSQVPMWGYTCGAAPATATTATCAALSPINGWSPVIITVPTGATGGLQINLTNSLTFANGNTVPTSIMIVGQVGGGLGTGATSVASPSHANLNSNTVTWPIAGSSPSFAPPPQSNRVQSFGTEVAAGATTSLTWASLKPGTYLLESGTHPSIQVPMGLYGILVVTNAPTATAGKETAPGCAYGFNATTLTCGIAYDAEVPMVFGEIDPVQNEAVTLAVNTSGFKETNVWSGQTGGCGDPTSTTYMTCYPPAVNYTPTYYTVNGVAFNKGNTTNSLFNVSPANIAPAAGTGSVLVRMVNAGLRMHVPSIVGSQVAGATGGTNPIVTGFDVVAEDGNPLPGVPKIRSEIFMAAGKVYDVMINGQSTSGTAVAPYANALAIFDRELSLSGNRTTRDAGMLAYIGINGAKQPVATSTTTTPQLAKANADSYILTPGQILQVNDPSVGVIANDIGVFQVQLLTQSVNGTVAMNANGTFAYYPTAGSTATTDSFTYCANGTVTGTTCSSGITATVSLTQTTVAGGITCSSTTFNSTIATYLAIKTPGILAGCKDSAGLPLSIKPSSVAGATGGLSVNVDGNGGFTATTTGSGAYSFSVTVQNTAGNTASASVSLSFPTPSNLTVNVVDGYDKTTKIADYRWIIEEDRTFFVDPNCQTNPPASTCPTTTLGTVPTLGVNFHTSNMPFVAQGCTGPLSCEQGQTVLGQPAVCDISNGVCRPDTLGTGMTAVMPSSVHLDPTKHYYVSVLPGDAATPFNTGNAQGGHGMGGAQIAPAQTTVTVLAQPTPFPPGKLSVFVFEDDFPLNGEQDGGGGVDVLSPIEPGLGGFQLHLWDAMGGNGDFTGQMTYDMFNQPLSNGLAGTVDPNNGNDACPLTANPLNDGNGNTDPTATGITGMIVTCPKYESDGVTLSPLAGQAVVNNLMPGRWGVIASPGADRIARGEEWLQTNTLDGQKAHDVFTRIGEPSYFQEYGPASYHVSIGFANPAIINARKPFLCNGTDPFSPTVGTGYNCTNTITGKVTSQRLSRTPDERLYSSGSHDAFYWTQCYVSFGDPDGEDFAFAKCNNDGTFTLSGLPGGDWRLTVFDQWNDLLVDGLSTPVGIGNRATDPNGNSTSNTTVALGDVASTQWQTNLYTKTFIDDNRNGIWDGEDGVSFANVAVRLRDGSLENLLVTDFTGTANFNETFPLFSWYVVETDVTRYKNTGTHVVYDVGGPADGSASCGQTGYPPCGNSVIAKNLANTAEVISLPLSLRIPGSIYCAGADCTGKDMTGLVGSKASDPPSVCTTSTGTPPTPPITTCTTQLSSGRIDNPWTGGVEGWQGFPGQNSFVEFGKAPYYVGENGGIKGHVVYASTRPFDDPQLLVQTQWEPLVPHVTINLYQEGVSAVDGKTPTLTLVDHTTTSSFDDWAQGFRPGTTIPNMNCPGQGAAAGQGATGNTVTPDLFFFSLANQPQYLDFYNNVQHGTGAATPLPYNSQFKCYDGMHNWNQVEPAPYDGMYQFPSVTSLDATGRPNGTNCTICSATPDPAPLTGDGADPLRHGLPMLPPGKYVVEVVVPPGFELVKEEDKNILIGDDFIAPATQEFGGLGAVYIIPDQASVATYYAGPGMNTYNAQNPTTSLGTSPSNNIVPGFIPEPTWPCVGEARVVPDFISLYPQSGEVAPFAGATRNLCDRKEVTLADQMGAIAKFYVYTSTHIASKFTGGITDDYTSEFDPFSPQFGEKFAPPNLPVSVKDWAGNEITRVYADHWGAYDGMTYSTWEVNPPNPTGYSPSMMVVCMNDPGPIAGPNGTQVTDPSFTPGYSQFCYELPFMPGTTQYLDTPVVPTSGFAGAGYNNVDCAYPASTPAIAEVDGDGLGPWVGATTSGAVYTVAVTNGGSGYTSAPAVSFTAGGGTGATATAVVNGTVTGVSVGNHGTGYISVPTITFNGGGNGSGAAATAVLQNSVGAVDIINGGTYLRTAPVPTVSFPTGCTAVATAHMINTGGLTGTTRRVSSVTISTAGAGCNAGDTVTFSAATGPTAVTATGLIGTGVASIVLNSGGGGYTSAPTVTFSNPATGSRATGTVSESGKVIAVTVTAGGTGYSPSFAVSFTGGGGSAAAGTASAEASGGGNLTITALGDQVVPNYGYTGPAANTAPFNQKTITRHYGFGGTAGTVALMGSDGVAHALTGVSWSDLQITGKVPSGLPNCAVEQQTQYGGQNAQCGQLIITNSTGVQSIDTVTVTIGGKAPTHVAATASIQTAIDAAAPGDMLIIDPTAKAGCATTTTTNGVTTTTPASCTATGAAVLTNPASHSELLLMWKPVRLQGVGSASSILSANTHPAGKLDPWRARVNCLFGLNLKGTPITTGNPFDPTGQYSCPGAGWNYFQETANNAQVDPLPLEAIVGWDASQNGNLAQLLQEPSLLGALEGAGITVLGKGVDFVSPLNAPGGVAGELGGFPAGTTLLQNVPSYTDPSGPTNYPASTTQCSAVPNPFPSNYMCNPSTIDGLAITQSSQGGGAVFVHGWGHNLQIANDHIYSNAGTLAGGINLGQGEFAPSYVSGSSTNAAPFSCTPAFGGRAPAAGTQLPYCENTNVNIHNNNISLNSSTGDELFSGTPAGAGGVTICTGSDFYKFNYNWVCGNLSSGDGGGVGHLGVSYNGSIAHNTIIFNQSINPTVPANGGGLLVMGTPDVDTTCGGSVDIDCLDPAILRTPSDGIGPNLVVDSNLIMGNAAETGSGGGLRLQDVNGTDVLSFPTAPSNWYQPLFQNNIIANNVAGWDGGGVSVENALNVNFINNTVVSNSTTASAGILFTTIGAPLASSQGSNCMSTSVTSCPQPAGLVTVQNTSNLVANLQAVAGGITCPANHYGSASAHNGTCLNYSYPLLMNNVFWQNSAYYIGVGAQDPQYQQNVVSLYNAFTTTLAPTQPQAAGSTAHGTGRTITGGTGACTAASYWDLGVRGDTGPTNHGSGVTLAPSYSVITSLGATTDYAAAGQHNTAGGPNFVSQYCNGARTPPEFGASGYDVPPGISDATVPNPIFNLTPVATVDEGNNWINLRWGPLSLLNPVTNAVLGNYGTTAGASTINLVPNGTSNYTNAPSLDFFGTNRKTNGAVDAGAVEFAGSASVATLSVTGGPLNFGNVAVGTTSAAQTLTLHNTGGAQATTIAVAVTAPFSRPAGASGGTCGTTLNAGATCTINIVFSPTATGAVSPAGSATITASVGVTGSPVALNGTGVAAVIAATLTPTSHAYAAQTRSGTACGTSDFGCLTAPIQVFTLTNTGNVTLTGIAQGSLGGTNPADFNVDRLVSTCGPAGGGQLLSTTTLAPGASCIVTVAFHPLTSDTTGAKSATISVSDAAGTQASTLTGTAN